MMKRGKEMRKQFKMVANVLLLCGLTAYVNPLAGGIKASESSIVAQDKAEGESRKEQMAAYSAVLKGIYYQHKYPDGQDCGFNYSGDVSDNQFAIYDVDGDGKDELIIEITTTCTAGMCVSVYSFDEITHVIREEFRELPLLTIYNNGLIKAGWSHNQGLAGEFWPYTLYQYQSKNDCFAVIGEVDAWDKTVRQTDHEGNAFPDILDKDRNGLVYFVTMTGEGMDTSMIDDAEYSLWLNGYLGDAQELVVPYKKLTEENIAGIIGQ